VGNGTTIITTMPTIAAGIAICPIRFEFTSPAQRMHAGAVHGVRFRTRPSWSSGL
jgi:hypothetical protein